MPRLPLPVRPVPDYPHECEVFVNVVADGVPVQMLLDTSSGRTSIPHRDLSPGDPEPGDSTGPGDSSETIVRVATLRWGQLTTRDLLVYMDPPDWPYPPLLGRDVLDTHTCHFRFTRGVLELDVPAPSGTLLALSTPPNSTQPLVPVEWETASTTAVWDTSSRITTVNRCWADEHPDIVTISQDHGDRGRNPKGRLAPCRIGDVDFPEQFCGVAELTGDLKDTSIVLGLPLISHANWYIDFPRHLWSISAG